MKKNVTIILAALLAVSLTACGNSEQSSGTNSTNQQTVSNNSTTNETSKPEESSTPTEASQPEESSAPDQTSEPSSDDPYFNDALKLLNTAWHNVTEDNKFPVFGGAPGDDIENIVDNAPGNVPVDNTNALEIHLAFPASSADKIDSAASLIHMMNANTFTAGAYHVKDAGTISEVASAIKDCVMNKQWMCGFPEKLVIVTVDDIIVSAYGNGELVDAFIDGVTFAYPPAQTVCDEPITMGGDPVADVGGLGIPLDWWRTDNEIMYL